MLSFLKFLRPATCKKTAVGNKEQIGELYASIIVHLQDFDIGYLSRSTYLKIGASVFLANKAAELVAIFYLMSVLPRAVKPFLTFLFLTVK